MLAGLGPFIQDSLVTPVPTLSYSGTRLYVMNLGDNRIYQYSLSTAFDLTTISGPSGNGLISENEGQGIYMKDDGSVLFLTSSSGDDIEEHTLSTNFDITTLSFTREILLSGSGNWIGIFVKPDGTKIFYVDSNSDTVRQRTLSTAWSLSGGTGSESQYNIVSEQGIVTGIELNPDGTKMFICGVSSPRVHAYDLSTAWDVTSASYNGEVFDPSSQTTKLQALRFNNDGTHMYIIDRQNNTLFDYVLTTPYDVSTASYTGESTGALSSDPTSFCWG